MSSLLSVSVKDGMLRFGHLLDADLTNRLGGETPPMLSCFGSTHELSLDTEETVLKLRRTGAIFLDFVWKVNLLERIIAKCTNSV